MIKDELKHYAFLISFLNESLDQCFCNSTMSGTPSSTFLSVWPMFLQLMSLFLNCIFAASAHFLTYIFWSFFKPTLSLVFTYSKWRCLSQFLSSIFQFKASSAECRQSYKTSLSRPFFFFMSSKCWTCKNPTSWVFHKFFPPPVRVERISSHQEVCVSVTELVLGLDSLSFMLQRKMELLQFDFHIRGYICSLAIIFTYL